MATYDPTLLDAIEDLAVRDYQGRVWRHMFNDYLPDRVNLGGARWNPRGVGAIYTALHQQTALAEGQHAVDVQPRRPFARRVLYELEVAVSGVVDLTTSDALTAVGLTQADLTADVFDACQRVGGAAAWLERGGLLVPSARDDGDNLVIFVTGRGLDDDITTVSHEVVEERTRST
jgi:RES domain-containing protein